MYVFPFQVEGQIITENWVCSRKSNDAGVEAAEWVRVVGDGVSEVAVWPDHKEPLGHCKDFGFWVK